MLVSIVIDFILLIALLILLNAVYKEKQILKICKTSEALIVNRDIK